MGKKGNPKISKMKRNNQTTNKMKKQGKLKLQRHKTKVQKHKQPTKPQLEYSSESETLSGDEWKDMLDEEEQQYIMSRIAKQPQLLAHVPQDQDDNKAGKKRKQENKEWRKSITSNPGSVSGVGSQEFEDLEDRYEKEMADRPSKRLKMLLPIKTKQGLQQRTAEYEDSELESEEEGKDTDTDVQKETNVDDSESDSGVEVTAGGEGDDEEGEVPSDTVTAVELLAARRDRLQHDKLRIGALCSSLLETPESKLKNLFPILYLMEERLRDGALNLVSVRKLATVSACEVFRDLLPEYRIRHQDYSDLKLKKETLALYKYEKEMLEFYKRYLQRLEKAAALLRRKKGDTRRLEQAPRGLALVSLQCMCDLLVARPQFNFAANIAQSVVPFLDCGEVCARDAVSACCGQVFARDTTAECTLTIVRVINQLAKRRGERLHPAALNCLLTLRIRDVDLDADADLRRKKTQDQKHKKRILNLSKKEKKRAKKLKEVERELLETEAQESAAARGKRLTAVVETVFHIYFRILKSAPSSGLLTAALNGLAKFAHVINVEYYSDLVRILARLIAGGEGEGGGAGLGAAERLACARTALSVLSGAGGALTLDPALFHAHLYASAIHLHAGETESQMLVALEALCAVCARARSVPGAVLVALAKRLGTLAAQHRPHAALACLAALHRLGQQCPAVWSLLESGGECAGSGRFDPLLPSPEHSGAHAAGLRELSALRAHYHPEVRDAARALLERRAPHHLAKLSPLEIFAAYDGSQMCFRPPVAPPPTRPAHRPARAAPSAHSWAQPTLAQLCQTIEDNVQMCLYDSSKS